MIDPETPKEIAKATGEIAKLGQETTKFLHQVLGLPIEQFAGIFGDQFQFVRRLQEMILEHVLDRTRARLEAAKVQPHKVPIKLLLPMLANASVEENEFMQEMWASLLAAAADPARSESVLPAFPNVLTQMTPSGVEWLARMVNEAKAEREKLRKVYEEDPKAHDHMTAWIDDLVVYDLLSIQYGDAAASKLVISDLARLGLCSDPDSMAYGADAVVRTRLRLTRFGLAFYEACQPALLKVHGNYISGLRNRQAFLSTRLTFGARILPTLSPGFTGVVHRLRTAKRDRRSEP